MKELDKIKILDKLKENFLTNKEASILLNLSIRQIKRLKKKYRDEKEKGIIHGLKGKVGNRKIKKRIVDRIVKIKTNKQNKYYDFSIQLFKEKLEENHNIKIGYSSLRNILIDNKLHKIRKRNNKNSYYALRERKEYQGELIQFDGAYKDFFEGRCVTKGYETEQCLLVAVDDATGLVTAKFDKNEGKVAVFKFWKEYIEKKGKPINIYLDKFSTYKINHPNAVDEPDLKTQFRRVMEDELNIPLIFANSPQAKGRVERMNKTLKDRLVKEMRLKNIKSTKEANEFLKNEFLPKFNKQFGVKAKKEKDLHIILDNIEKEKLDKIFSFKDKRKVRNDFVVSYQNHYFQLSKIQTNVTVYKKDEVTVVVDLDNNIYLFKKDKEINYIVLKEKPKKEINLKLSLINSQDPVKKSNWKPPIDHP